MELNVAKELAELRRMASAELRQKYLEVIGEPSRSRHKDWLIKRIIWRLQAHEEGGLSERAQRRALELANDADLRLAPPRERKANRVVVPVNLPGPEVPAADDRVPGPGSTIARRYKGRTIEVRVRDHGFEYEGIAYRTLSAVAKAVTGTHTNGFLFFRLGKYGGGR